MKERVSRVVVLLSKYHGSNQQLLALAKEIAGDNVVALRCEMKSRNSWLIPIYRLAMVLKNKFGANAIISGLIGRLFFTDFLECRESDLVLAKTRPFEIPLQFLVAGSRAKSCYLGSPKRFPRDKFDYLISTPSTPVLKPSVELDVMPTSFTYAEFIKQRGASSFDDRPVWTLLLGGDARGYHYSEKDWRALADFLGQSSSSYGFKWLITSSPRTGVQNEALLERLLKNNGFIGDCYWWGDSKENCPDIIDLLRRSSGVITTEDSASMMSEAVNTRLPVVIIKPTDCRAKNSLTVPLAEALEANDHALRSSTGNINFSDIQLWEKTVFTPVEKCWSDSIAEMFNSKD